MCLYCSESKSILHSFVECEESKSFFDKVISWFNKANNSKYSPTIVQKRFQMLHNVNDKHSLDSTIVYSSPNISYIIIFAKNLVRKNVTSTRLLRN